MTTHIPEGVSVQASGDHVEVVGLDKEAVEYALSLAEAVAREQIQARDALSTRVNQVMIDAGVPLVSQATQRQIQRSADLRKRLLDDERGETYASLAERRGGKESSARTWVSRQRKRHELFTVEAQGITVIPTVQLTAEGGVKPAIAPLVRELAEAGLDGWSLWAWLTSPTGLLSGDVPAAVAAHDPARAHRAAKRYAAELRRAQDSAA